MVKSKRKAASVYAVKAQGRPMANGGGMRRARRRLRKQVKTALRQGRFDLSTRFTQLSHKRVCSV